MNQQYSMKGNSDHNNLHDDHRGQMRSISDDCIHVIIRPYTCAFCNRSFSSAQALGGHMNIHRKDRAKLKLQALAAASAEDRENMLLDPRALDDRKNTPDHDHDQDFFFLELHQQKIGNSTIPDHNRPISSAQGHATSTSDRKDGEEEEKKKMQLSLMNRSLSVPELDLELRLGPAGLPAGWLQ